MNALVNNLLEQIDKGHNPSVDEIMVLYEHAHLPQLMLFADRKRRFLNANNVYYVKNYHIEPTNICVFQCRFCSFSAPNKQTGWAKSHNEIIEEVNTLGPEISELHIVGGSNPEYDLNFYANLLREIKRIKPQLHLKAFTAAEIHYMAELAGMDIKQVLQTLKLSGLNSMPGGGAEIFDDAVRKQICPDKINANLWLQIHRTAHELGIPSNATMLFGHLETPRQRFEHMELLRLLQEETKGFNAFILLKFKNMNNKLSGISETGFVEDLRMFALSRLFFHNIIHLKVYWPAFGKEFAQLALSAGVDDLDGTIDNSTKIYSMAGAEEQLPSMSETQACEMIRNAGFVPVLRDALYNY
jgi:aminodeoxyfutalosine synthase